jgi:hypothetical protein
MWDYNVSHKQLLVRSPQTSKVPDNVDVIFWGVRFIGTPTSFVGIIIRNAFPTELASVEVAAGKCDIKEVFCIQSENKTHFIVAGGLKVLKNQLVHCHTMILG